ncbi:MAG: M18 family aminopeptidase [Clostridia bacterium]|nr:M18 family aminopeptidase [Clostridia bacterium]
MNPNAREFLNFAAQSPTAFHAVAKLAELLEEAGYTPLSEAEAWQLKAGDKRYVTRNGSALIAFRVPEKLESFRIAAAHADSPTLKLKELAEDAGQHYVRLNVEKYGGLILSTWLDRPLSIAGRVIIRDLNGLRVKLVDLNRDAVLIPNVPIHFNRQVNDGYKFNPQVDMLPLYGDGAAKGRLNQEIAETVGVSVQQILGSDLFLYDRTPGSIWGAENEFFSCGRIDDLECAWTALAGFLASESAADFMPVYSVFDNEEVGSTSKQGADSTFLGDVLTRSGEALGLSAGEVRAAIASGFMASADNAHALHPNHPELYDAQNRVYMNGGVVIKHSANQKYTTDGVSSALFTKVCDAAQVPCQHFANRSDILGGGTLGNISNSHVSMNTVDIGLAQLAMHSSYETAGTKDVGYMAEALKAFYGMKIRMTGDGEFLIG